MRVAINAAISLRERNGTKRTYPDGGGVDCSYYKLSNKVGLKYYQNQDVGFYCYSLQKLLHAHDLAPDCWGFSEKDGKVAFFTEHVIVAGDCSESLNINIWDQEYIKAVDDLRETVCGILGIEKSDQAVYDADQDRCVIKNAYPRMDMHAMNIGVVPAGNNYRLILIDVGFVKTSPKAPLNKYAHENRLN